MGPKPQLKPKPALPPKPIVYQRPVAKPRKQPQQQQQQLPKVPPKPKSPVFSSISAPENRMSTVDRALSNKSSEVVNGGDKVLKPVGRPPPPPPKAHSKSLTTAPMSSYVKKPTPAKGSYVVPTSKDQDGTNKKQGNVVELKESDDELDNTNEIVIDTVSSRDSELGSTEVDSATSVKETDKRK